MTIEELGTADAIRRRQEELIHLLRGLRAFVVALVCLFVVLGVICIVLYTYLVDTRDITRRIHRQEIAVLCEVYANNGRNPPIELDCR